MYKKASDIIADRALRKIAEALDSGETRTLRQIERATGMTAGGGRKGRSMVFDAPPKAMWDKMTPEAKRAHNMKHDALVDYFDKHPRASMREASEYIRGMKLPSVENPPQYPGIGPGGSKILGWLARINNALEEKRQEAFEKYPGWKILKTSLRRLIRL